MKQRGRKSAESQGLPVAADLDRAQVVRRPDPPLELTPEETNEWVRVVEAMPAGSLLVADFMSAATYGLRQDVTVDIGWVNDQFAKNMLTIRAEMRSALIVHSPQAVRFGDLEV